MKSSERVCEEDRNKREQVRRCKSSEIKVGDNTYFEFRIDRIGRLVTHCQIYFTWHFHFKELNSPLQHKESEHFSCSPVQNKVKTTFHLIGFQDKAFHQYSWLFPHHLRSQHLRFQLIRKKSEINQWSFKQATTTMPSMVDPMLLDTRQWYKKLSNNVMTYHGLMKRLKENVLYVQVD